MLDKEEFLFTWLEIDIGMRRRQSTNTPGEDVHGIICISNKLPNLEFKEAKAQLADLYTITRTQSEVAYNT